MTFSAKVVLTAPHFSLSFGAIARIALLESAKIFVGKTGDSASLSADQPNAAKLGSDGKILVDDVMQTNCGIDFMSIYQLSK